MAEEIIQNQLIEESNEEHLRPLSRAYTGIIFISPNGKKWFLTVSDDGTIITTEVTE